MGGGSGRSEGCGTRMEGGREGEGVRAGDREGGEEGEGGWGGGGRGRGGRERGGGEDANDA